MWLWLEPLDVLMFRDSRPFAGGETHRARSLFPPSPLTLQGALRTKLLAHALAQQGRTIEDFARYLRKKDCANTDFAELVRVLGDADQFGSFCMIGPFVAQKASPHPHPEPFFPIPLDLLGLEHEKGVTCLSPLSKETYAQVKWDQGWNEQLQPLWRKPEKAEVKELPNFWLSSQDLRNYLEGQIGNVHPVAASNIYAREQRVGIKLRPGTRTAEIGMLYTAEFIRLQKGCGFVAKVEIDGANASLEPLEQAGLLSLGGEARACWHEKIEHDPLKALQETKQVGSEGAFKLYLAAPAVFQKGWLPDFLDPNSLMGSIGELEVRLVAAAVGKPLPIGGWDLAHNKPKNLYYAVPPGSVYFFEVRKGAPSKARELFHGKTRLQRAREANQGQWLTELAKVGFGLTFVGRWDHCPLRR